MRSRKERVEWLMGIREAVIMALPPDTDEVAVAIYTQALLQEEQSEELVQAVNQLDRT